MQAPNRSDEAHTARVLAGALTHLAQHLESGCRRSVSLAAMLLGQIASDSRNDAQLRDQAGHLTEVLDDIAQRKQHTTTLPYALHATKNRRPAAES